jgi:hypothetical protein
MKYVIVMILKIIIPCNQLVESHSFCQSCEDQGRCKNKVHQLHKEFAKFCCTSDLPKKKLLLKCCTRKRTEDMQEYFILQSHSIKLLWANKMLPYSNVSEHPVGKHLHLEELGMCQSHTWSISLQLAHMPSQELLASLASFLQHKF